MRSSARCSVSVIRSSGEATFGSLASLQRQLHSAAGSSTDSDDLGSRWRPSGSAGPADAEVRLVRLDDRRVRRRSGSAASAATASRLGDLCRGDFGAVTSGSATSGSVTSAGATCGFGDLRFGDLGRGERVEVEVCRLLERVGGLAHLPHRFVERRLQLALEPAAHLLELAVHLAELAHGVGQSFSGPSTIRAISNRKTISLPLRLNIAGESTSWTCVRNRTVASFRGAAAPPVAPRRSDRLRPSRGAGPCPGEHPRRRSNWRSNWAPTAWRATSGSPPTACRCSTTTAWSGGRSGGLARSARCCAPTCPDHIPSLAELIERCGSQYHLSLDLKDAAAGQSVIDVVAESRSVDAGADLAVCAALGVVAAPSRTVAPSWSTRRAWRASRRGPSAERQRCAPKASTRSICITPTGTEGWWRCSTGSSGWRSAGTCRSRTSCRPHSEWASTGSTATGSTG